MARFRFTIGGLLAVVVFVAVAIAALRAADDLWASSLFSLTVGALLVATLLAVHRTAEKRAFWLGFALFGWTYLAACLIAPIEPLLLTTKALAYLDSKVPKRIALDEVRLGGVADRPIVVRSETIMLGGHVSAHSGRNTVSVWDAATGKLISGPGVTSENLMRIGHMLLALLIALLGGRLSRTLHAGENRRHADTPAELSRKQA
jgi:hypothetical protein